MVELQLFLHFVFPPLDQHSLPPEIIVSAMPQSYCKEKRQDVIGLVWTQTQLTYRRESELKL